MAVALTEENGGKLLEVQASGKLTKDDYDRFVPEVERLIHEHGKIRLLFDMRDFHGWTPGAMWADIKFDMKHFRDIDRLAIVGETKWQRGMATFCRPFSTAKVHYFPHDQSDQAHAWLSEEPAKAGG